MIQDLIGIGHLPSSAGYPVGQPGEVIRQLCLRRKNSSVELQGWQIVSFSTAY